MTGQNINMAHSMNMSSCVWKKRCLSWAGFGYVFPVTYLSWKRYSEVWCSLGSNCSITNHSPLQQVCILMHPMKLDKMDSFCTCLITWAWDRLNMTPLYVKNRVLMVGTFSGLPPMGIHVYLENWSGIELYHGIKFFYCRPTTDKNLEKWEGCWLRLNALVGSELA